VLSVTATLSGDGSGPGQWIAIRVIESNYQEVIADLEADHQKYVRELREKLNLGPEEELGEQ
jgi:hypothetical protein